MDTKELLTALTAAVAIIGIMSGIIYGLIRKDLENLRNIPPKEWFDEVKESLGKISTLEQSDKYYIDEIRDLKHRVWTLEQRKQ